VPKKVLEDGDMNRQIFTRTSLLRRLVLTIIGIEVAFLALVIFWILPAMKARMLEERKAKVKDVVESSMGAVEFFHSLERSGAMSREEAQAKAKEALRMIRYGPDGKDYLFVIDQEPAMVMHPYRPDLEGKYMGDFKDPKGTLLFKDMVKVCQQKGGGFVSYWWQYKDDKSRLYPKISYVKAFEPWGWILGTGVYVHEIGQAYRVWLLRIYGVTALLCLISFALFFVFFRRNIAHPLNLMRDFVRRVSKGDYSARVELPCRDELGELAEGMNRMAVEVQRRDKEQQEAAAKIETQQRELQEQMRKMQELKEEVERARRKLASDVGVLAEHIKRLAEGDFSVDLVIEDEAAELKDLVVSLNHMLDRQREMLLEVSVAADQVASAAAQVAEASQSLAEGASEQAASLEETSSSMEEVASMARSNVEGVQEGDRLMKETSEVVDRTRTSMKDVMGAMEEIAKASENTQKIVKTIDEIAFQTNLLALNAAVEAARAGEAGAGFAVVADEVRSLAQRSAEAARQTAELIEAMMARVAQGKEILARAEGDFSQVAERAEKVAQIMAEIAAASREQAQGIEQIKEALSQMDRVTQQVAANAEESTSAAEQMKAQAETLKGIVARFKLKEESKVEGPTFSVMN